MKFNVIEIINVLIVILLLNVILRGRDVATLLLALFAYGTLHFSFAAIALATNESASLLVELHTEGSGVLAKLSTLSLLGIVLAMLSVLAYDAWAQNRKKSRKVELHILLAMGIVFCGYLLNFRQGDWLQLKNVISIEIMLILMTVGFLGATSIDRLNAVKVHAWVVVGLLILCATDCIAIYEVFAQQSWAGTLESSGAMVYRASSILFNPNLFAFWASLVYLACAYGMHEWKEYRRVMLWGMVLASVAIYFSGSRSAGYLLLGMLLISAVLLKGRSRWLPLLILPVTMLVIYAGAAWLAAPLFPGKGGWNDITLLGERFAAAPLYLANYVLKLAGATGIVSSIDVPPEVTVSIEGRFEGGSRDAGWLVLYQDVGWLGTAAMLWISVKSLQWAVHAYFAEHSAASVFALTTLCCCLMTGFVMRFQIFPVWIFIGVTLIPCLMFWSGAANPKPTTIGNDARANS